MLSLLRAGVRSLVGELRPHKLCSAESQASGNQEKTTWPSLAGSKDPSTAAQEPVNQVGAWERAAPGPMILREQTHVSVL